MHKFFLLCLAVAFAACSKPADPQHAMLDAFVDSYIHRADPAGTRPLAVGEALAKLESEMSAVAGQPRPTTFPDVEYSIVDQRAAHDSVTFELELKIKGNGEQAFTRDLIITGALLNAEWKVVDFYFLK